ncbi:hypothetical protein [Dictyobacter formicarum]|uniref:Uncharacterized protein n=1 Tax=Dictyobacter formicarum TaxID=2778368 RepID=A0ABQ3VB78_9CHLR|nr:hypothetical protein [Dictyobacter formicarum]GHO82721.1 hypothetical protein KSZ_07270 [Dictyobacter formicarum]
MEVCEGDSNVGDSNVGDSNVSRRFSTFRAGNGRTFTPFTNNLALLARQMEQIATVLEQNESN